MLKLYKDIDGQLHYWETWDSDDVGCIVIDFEIAKKVIEQDLKDTEFADFARIYKME